MSLWCFFALAFASAAFRLSAADVEETIAGAGCFAGDEGPDYYGPDTCVRYSLAVPRGELVKALDHLDKALSVKGL